MSRIETAVSTFNEGFSCSQAIFSAFSEELGLDPTTALRVAGAFGGGMAATAKTCGAVTGALMVIGLRYAMVIASDDAAKKKTYDISREFMRRFAEKNGSIVCAQLLGVDISTPEGHKRAKDEGLTKSLCPGFVRSAAEIIEEILSE